MKVTGFAALLALGVTFAIAPALAQAPNPDPQLLATFCDAANIKGSTCTRAKGYRSGRRCDVKLEKGRYIGRFLADGSTLLVVSYGSDCEAHNTNFGGSVIFERKDGATIFKGYQPGFWVNDCITVPRNHAQDRLICVTGYMGQGLIESGVAEMVFTRDFSRTIAVSRNYFVTAEDATNACGTNIVECKEPSKYFGISRPGPGPQRDTVAVDIDHADKETIETACTKGFPLPKEISRELIAGEAYVPPGHEKKARFVIALLTSRAAPETVSGNR